MAFNDSLPLGQSVGYHHATYTVEATLAGAAGKVLLAVFNPAASGKLLKIWQVRISVPDSSGTDVVIDYEARKIEAYTGGVAATPARARTSTGATVATAASAPSSATDIATETPLFMHWTAQLNQAQSPVGFLIPLHHGPECDPLCLEEGQGVAVKQIDSNTGDVRVGVTFTEEAK